MRSDPCVNLIFPVTCVDLNRKSVFEKNKKTGLYGVFCVCRIGCVCMSVNETVCVCVCVCGGGGGGGTLVLRYDSIKVTGMCE